ncbi:MAG: hypothetical protein ACHQT9_02725 [Candidatus Saccharimonadales bacterium]
MDKIEQLKSEITAHREIANTMRERAVYRFCGFGAFAVLAYTTGKHGQSITPEVSGVIAGGFAGWGFSGLNNAAEHCNEAAVLSGVIAKHELSDLL